MDEEYFGVSEVAECAGVSTAAVCNWRKRKYKMFPRPVAVLALGPVWRADDIRKWLREVGRVSKGIKWERFCICAPATNKFEAGEVKLGDWYLGPRGRWGNDMMKAVQYVTRGEAEEVINNMPTVIRQYMRVDEVPKDKWN